MSNVPNDLKFCKSHEWVSTQEGNVVTVGISDHAQALLGDLVFVELPEVGTEFSAGDECCVVESVKAASDVYAPVSGKVVEINEELNDTPELINQMPYTDGWIFKLEISDESELDDLLNSSDYEAVIAEE